MVHFIQALHVMIISALCLVGASSNGVDWRPILEPRLDRTVVAVAEYAVKTHNRFAKTTLQLEKILRAYVYRNNERYSDYKLFILAQDKNVSHQYEAYVGLVDPSTGDLGALTSFKLLD